MWVTPSFRDGPPELGFTRVQLYHCPSRQPPTWMDQTSDAQLRIGESRDSGFDARASPGMTFDAGSSAASSTDLGFRAPHCPPHRPMLHCALPARVLPRLGGSPAVWSVAMVFFQLLLLGGYAYAHYLMQIRSRLIPVAVHLALLVVAFLTLPLSIASGWGELPTSGYAFWLLGLFAVSIGLPFFALAANNPLLQAWFVRTGHPSGPDPYFLYASSNIGSFLALLSYPALLEPMFTLRTQNLIWTCGYGLLIVLIASSGILLLRSPARAADLNMPADDSKAPA